MSERDEKEIEWWGSARNDLLDFPRDARREAGYQLSLVQSGYEPLDWKPFPEVGAGTKEIRIKEEGPDGKGIFRVMYVAKFEEAIHVLHCFKKTTQATSTRDKHIATERYKALIQWRKDKKISK